MGPFRGDHVAFGIDNAQFIGDAYEDGTGTYYRDFVVPTSETPRNLRVIIREVMIEREHGVGSGAQ
ncbi:MAG: hypothetical protein GTN62_07050 [Gemmatimonadales bacterium]|nr:hypothetical protein [Gemmatimonadales bacterium]NIN11257.1 hypothetical protein [Gemmatimonadales bacterium]NIN49856.1 hypothetical protein [Gemmatimonadales bacterium]NIP07320.1 hypothetical protein [Gemmatimonadales bacterium]NIR03015.1 hypothetical protein [Gemmatimonadales bacterium]